MQRPVHLFVVMLVASLLGIGVVAAGMGGCSDDALKAPRSDTQYDDPDDPGTGGVPGAVDATTRDATGSSDAGADAQDAGDAKAAEDASEGGG
ncbi:hypothetical protein LZC95_18910 [Pendulispora brunnea]|uniref:Secreted protein n=1 Tax=Pendulispora brunnea TaxID=2905690 RepID=A0ABZ2KK06_9BACT